MLNPLTVRASMLLFVLMTSSTNPVVAVEPEDGSLAKPSSLTAALRESGLPLRLVEGRLVDRGGEVLIAASRESRFVLLGEAHGLAEVSEFTEALFRDIQPYGFDTYVTEIGPRSARRINKLVAENENPIEGFERLFSQYPFAIPFVTYQEEVELLVTITELSKSAVPIWGIDQEFFLSPRFHLASLAEHADGRVGELLDHLVEREVAAYELIVSSADPAQPSFMTQPLPAEWSEIRSHFEEHSESGLAVLDAIEESHRIYRHFAAGRYYMNNHDRARLMKKYLASYLKRFGEDQRLIVKLGANHVVRGFSPLGISDIGNSMAEIAALEGEESLHILIMSAGGERNGWLPFLPLETRRQKVDSSQTGGSLFHPLTSALPESEDWRVYDLRSLHPRAKKLSDGSAAMESLIRSFDLIVMIDESRAATLVSTLAPSDSTEAM